MNGEWVVFVDALDSNHVKIVSTDGKQVYTVSEQAQGGKLPIQAINLLVNENWIYYIDLSPAGNRQICRLRPDGSKKQVLSTDSALSFSLSEEHIYYLTTDSRYGLVGQDGYGQSTIFDGQKTVPIQAIAWRDWIYFSTYDSISKTRGMSGDIEKMLEGQHEFNIVDGARFFYSTNKGLYRMRETGVDVELIWANDGDYKNIPKFINLVGPWVVFQSNQTLFLTKADGTQKEAYPLTNN